MTELIPLICIVVFSAIIVLVAYICLREGKKELDQKQKEDLDQEEKLQEKILSIKQPKPDEKKAVELSGYDV